MSGEGKPRHTSTKPDQEVRLKAVEDLIQYLKTNNKVRQTQITVTERLNLNQHGNLLKSG